VLRGNQAEDMRERVLREIIGPKNEGGNRREL
jgi:hypothetical protein